MCKFNLYKRFRLQNNRVNLKKLNNINNQFLIFRFREEEKKHRTASLVFFSFPAKQNYLYL